MATIYCSKSGNDGNNGSTYLLSKLTIQAGITAAGSGGTVIIGSGLYNEKLTSSISSATVTLYCDGVVILDGSNLASNPAISVTTYNSNALAILPYSTGGQMVIQNHVATSLITGSNNYCAFVLSNVIMLSNSNTYGINYTAGSLVWLTLTNVVFSGFTTAVTLGGVNGTSVQLTIQNCTFYNTATGMIFPSDLTTIISSCIFSNVTTAWNLATAPTILSGINNNIYYNITNWKVGASTYTSQATLQAAGYDTLSLFQNPNFSDPTNNIFYLTSNPNTTNNPYLYYGAYPYGLTRGTNYNPDSTWNITATPNSSGWWNPDGDITLAAGNFQITTPNYVFVVSGITTAPTAGATYTNNTQTFTVTSTNLYGSGSAIYGTIACSATGAPTATGVLTKSAGTGDNSITYTNAIKGGQIWSPVWDLTSCQTISQFNIEAFQVWATSMADTTIKTTIPHYQTAEIRVGSSVFNQNDGTANWVELRNKIPFITQGSTNLTGRWVQLKITLRADDTAG